MADPYVIFPGTAGNYVSSDDVNLLDADTAHLAQSIGSWVSGVGAGLAWVANGGDYGSLEITFNGAQFERAVAAGPWPTPGGQPVVFAADFDNDGAPIDVLVRIVHDVDVYFDNTVTVPTGQSRQFVTGVASAGNVTEVRFQNPDGSSAGTFRVSKVLFAETADPTFVPSLRIVGDLFEDIEPADMPIVFAGDGTPLTVGEGWAGNGYHYRRYDGPDASAPLVAQFDAADIPQPAQLPI